MKKANREDWQTFRRDADSKSTAEAQQKTAEAAADNAIIATDLKKRLLLRLGRIEEKYPMDATEVKVRDGNKWATYRIRDLTAAYKDLTGDMPPAAAKGNELLQSLLDLERRASL